MPTLTEAARVAKAIAAALRELADDVDPVPTDGVLESLGVEWREDTAQDLRAWADQLAAVDPLPPAPTRRFDLAPGGDNSPDWPLPPLEPDVDNSPEARRARGLEPIRPAPGRSALDRVADDQRAAAQEDPRGEADR